MLYVGSKHNFGKEQETEDISEEYWMDVLKKLVFRVNKLV